MSRRREGPQAKRSTARGGAGGRRRPPDVREFPLGSPEIHLPALLVDALGVGSRSEARRLIQQGGVALDGDPVSALDLPASALRGRLLRAGKRRFIRLV